MARRVAREEYEQLCWMIKKWNENRLELFEITMPNEVCIYMYMYMYATHTHLCSYYAYIYMCPCTPNQWHCAYFEEVLYVHSRTCNMYIHDRRRQGKDICTPKTAFSFFKEKTALGGPR